jgi:hypothetical protein
MGRLRDKMQEDLELLLTTARLATLRSALDALGTPQGHRLG